MSSIGHILSTLGKAIVRVLLTALVGFIVGFGAVIAVVYVRLHHGPGTVTYISAVLVGLVLAYALGATVLMIAAVEAAFDVARGAVKDAGSAIGDVEHGIGSAVNTVEHRH